MSAEPAGEDPDQADGQHAQSAWSMPRGAWKEVAARTWRESSADHIGLVSAGVAFYVFLSLVPLLGATVLTYGLIADPAMVARQIDGLTANLPDEAAKIIGDQLLNIVETSTDKKGLGVAVALAIALFGARNAARAIISALNIAYEEDETRGFLKVNILALMITVSAILIAGIAMAAVAAIGYVEDLLPGTSPLAAAAVKVLSYAVLGLAASTAAAALYRYGPARDAARWTWLTPGSLFFAVAWAVLTLGFGFYVANFGNYGATYGSLSAVVVLLTWTYLSSYALLFGAELNSELEHQTARDTTKGPAEPIGERGAWAADNVA